MDGLSSGLPIKGRRRHVRGAWPYIVAVVAVLGLTSFAASFVPSSAPASANPHPEQAPRADAGVGPDQPPQVTGLTAIEWGPNWTLVQWTNPIQADQDNVSAGLGCSSLTTYTNTTFPAFPATVTYNFTDLDSTGTYCFGVATYSTSYSPPEGPPATTSATTLPYAPGTPDVISLAVTSVDVGWANSPKSPNITTNTVYYGYSCGSWTTSIQLPETDSYSVPNLASGTTYCFAVSANSSGGQGPLSPDLTATTLPSPPSGLFASDITQSSVILTWTDPFGTVNNTVAWGINQTHCKDFSSVKMRTSTTYTITGLSSGTSYCMGVSAWSDGGQGPATFLNQTTASVPAAPSGVSAVPATAQIIEVTWVNPPGPIVNLTVFYAPRLITGGCGGFTGIPVAPSPETLNVTSLLENTTYCFEVQAYNSTGGGAFSKLVYATTLGPPWAPYEPRATLSGLVVTLAWTNRNFTNVVTNTAWYSALPAGQTTCSVNQLTDAGTVTPSNTTGAGSTFFTLPRANTTYCFAVTSTSPVGNSSFSEQAYLAVPGPPLPVYGLGLQSVGSTFVLLQWTLNVPIANATAANVTVYYGTTCGSWVASVSAGGVVSSLNITNLVPQTGYCFNVGEWNEYGHSTLVPSADFTTTTHPPGTGPVQDFTVALVSAYTITLSWTNPAGTTNDTVFLATESGSVCGAWTQIISTHGPVGSYAFGALSPDTGYCFAVIAWTQYGPSIPAELRTSTVANNGSNPFSLPIWAYVAIAAAIVAALVLADLVVRRGWSPLRRKPRGPPPGAIHTWQGEPPSGGPSATTPAPPESGGSESVAR